MTFVPFNTNCYAMSIDFMRHSCIGLFLFLVFFGAGCSDLAGLSDPPAPDPIFFNTEQETGEVTVPVQADDEGIPLGARIERDGHGCLISSGFVWCESLGVCQKADVPCVTPVDISNDAELEAWIRGKIHTYFKEQTSLQRFVGQGFNLESVKKQSCSGCFSATAVFALPEDTQVRKVILFSFTQWQITEATVAEERIAPLTEALCADQGGSVFLVTEQSICPEGMAVLGRIADLDGLRACCLPQ